MAKRRRILHGVTHEDAVEAAQRIYNFCPMRWKTKQYVSICRKAAGIFLSELERRGTSRQAIADAANATDRHCETTYARTDQYRRVCEKISGSFIRVLAEKRPGLEGRGKRLSLTAPKVNPWAVCRAAGKKFGWSKAKIERCIRKVKARR